MVWLPWDRIFDNPHFAIAWLDQMPRLHTATGLELGAEDYVTKPFNLRERLARMRTVTTRVLHDRQRECQSIFEKRSLCALSRWASKAIAIGRRK